MIGALSLLVELVGLEFELSCGGGVIYFYFILLHFDQVVLIGGLDL